MLVLFHKSISQIDKNYSGLLKIERMCSTEKVGVCFSLYFPPELVFSCNMEGKQGIAQV